MPIYTAPGVYIEEIPTTPQAIEGVPTAIPAFIGVTGKRPSGPRAFHKVRSLAAYVRLFGGATIGKLPVPGYLYRSMALYFANGGGDAYVHSVGTSKQAPRTEAFLAGLAALEREAAPTLILFPDAVSLGIDGLAEVQKAALALCAKLGDRFCILDVPAADTLLSGGLDAFRESLGTENLAFGAAYGPWLRLGGLKPRDVPASGAVAGIYCQVDAERGVWKVPANVAVKGIAGLTEALNDPQSAALNVDPVGGKSINAIRSFTDKGILVWGARTLAGNDAEWRYVPVRRLFIMIEESIRHATGFVVFEPNEAGTWLKVRMMIETFLTRLWQAGALPGSRTQEAFYVHVGLGSTMTAQDILDGHLIVEVGVAPVRPAEFIILRFCHLLQTA